MRYFPAAILLMSLCLQACHQDNPNPDPEPDRKPTLEFPEDFTETDFTFPGAGESKTLTFVASDDWTVSVAVPESKAQADDWCTVAPRQGKAGPATVQISLSGNDSYDDRQAQISVRSGETVKSFSVCQRKKDAIILSGTHFELSSGEGLENSIYDKFTAIVEVKSNVEVSFQIPEKHQSWLHPVNPAENGTKGLISSTYTFSAIPNVHEQPREGIVIFFDAGSTLADTVYITQKAGLRESMVRSLFNEWPGHYLSFAAPYNLCEALYVHALAPGDGYDNEFQAFYDRRLTSSLPQIASLWSGAYKSIHPLNQAVGIIRPKSMPPFSDLLPYEYSVHILRSLVYLRMINFWGDAIPFTLKYDPYNYFMQVPADKICQTLIDSLQNYQVSMPEHPSLEYTYPPSVAEAVLAKLHFQKQEYAEALRYARSVIGCGRYALETQYDNAFTAQSSEAILTFPNAAGTVSADFSLVQKGPYCPAIRLAEMLLIAAESSLQSGDLAQAAETLNPLRRRNGRALLDASSDRTQIQTAILEEWEKDLEKEGLFFAALKRNDLAESTLGIESFRKLFPIPYGEINFNPYARQNQGY